VTGTECKTLRIFELLAIFLKRRVTHAYSELFLVIKKSLVLLQQSSTED
jgi:hypothetical protein